jgi:serine/threonine-protein kinase RIO1
MPDLPPDPRAVLDARVRHFKKETQKLNLEFLEAEAELEKMKQAARSGAPSPRPESSEGK